MVEKFTQISLEDFKTELETGKYTLIDSRTPGELETYGKISEDQTLINVNMPLWRIQVQKLDKSKLYLIYCWHGNRSATMREYMKEQGFAFACDLEGGIDAWNKQ